MNPSDLQHYLHYIPKDPLRGARMHKAFEVHMLNDQGKAKAKALAEAFDALLTKTTEIMRSGEGPNPDNSNRARYEALVATKLEEACFFAKKGMASQESNQGP